MIRGKKQSAFRLLRIESLSSRRMFAAELATGLSLEDARDQIAGRFDSATIVTHGFQIDGAGDSLMPLAEAIVERNGGFLVDIDVGAVDGAITFDLLASESKTGNELVFLFDWGDASNNDSAGWGEAAGDALFSIGAGLGLFDPDAGSANTINLHFIGHSFGTAVTSEAIERLAAFKVPVDHVTYLDPHDFDQARLPIDGSQRLFELGAPQVLGGSGLTEDGYGASVWNNVTFADVYYQTNPLGLIPINPGGRPIPGAYNVSLTQATEDFFIPHSAVWNDFYIDSVTSLDSTSGYAFSSRVIPPNDRPAAVFFGLGQEHDHTPEAIVNRDTGLPNSIGLGSLGLTTEQITNARWEPVWTPGIYNGNLDLIGNASDEVPGWVFHGGGGDSQWQTSGDGAVRLTEAGQSRTHNLVYFPKNVSQLEYEVNFGSSDDNAVLEILIDEILVESISLDSMATNEQSLATTSGVSRSIPIGSLGGRARTITFRSVSMSGSGQVDIRIDDITFSRSDRTFNSNHRTLVVETVEGQQAIPSDVNTIAIQFQAEANSFIEVESIDVTHSSSLAWTNLFVVNDRFESIGTVEERTLSAELEAGRTYAILFDPTNSMRTYQITSSAGDHSLNPLAPTNLFAPTDVNADGRVSALDALIVINALNALANDNGVENGKRPFLDVNHDGSITAVDALQVINVLNATVPRGMSEPEPIGEPIATGGRRRVDAYEFVGLLTDGVVDTERIIVLNCQKVGIDTVIPVDVLLPRVTSPERSLGEVERRRSGVREGGGTGVVSLDRLGLPWGCPLPDLASLDPTSPSFAGGGDRKLAQPKIAVTKTF
ncbi:dockerin type I domain-containing protein [Neorhodopirellula pilleata]|uniref:Dockerin type I repeat protein n=1 Tax=Neorhodopirellula pilleata TaxID=2714738 RepID=A0A5C6AE64_9BACT|nr:dockerin type I domain-containing protein [Neorhodopirellula pilleata]TWT97361.1 Dockerin type I repeat protein [Neorhodopirellula pilleata]